MSKKKRNISTLELGVTGIKQNYGKINEEPLKALRTLTERIKIFSQMSANDSIVAGNINALESLILKSQWEIKPFSDKPRHKKEAELAKKCIFEMDYSFGSILYEALSCIIYGFSTLEICYKKDTDTGYYIWRDLAPRSQDTLHEWILDENGKFNGIRQKHPTTFKYIDIPASKLLHFAPKTRKRNPEGVSLLRSAYLSWYYKSKITELEAIRIDKDVRGVPVAKAPSEYLNTKDQEKQAIQEMLKVLVTELSMNQNAGVVFPSDEGWELDTLKGGTSAIQDTNPIIERHNRDISISMLSDFVMLGKGASGSLADAKVKVFSSFVTYIMDMLQSVFNDGLRRLWIINGLNPDERPQLIHTNLEELEATMTALVLQSAHKLGLITPSAELENWIRTTMLKGSPKITDEDWQKGREEQHKKEMELKTAGQSKDANTDTGKKTNEDG